jgi:uncharacterized protein YjdB
VSAASAGISGSVSFAVTAAVPTLSSIAVTPANPSIASGATEQFTATATYSNGTTANVTSTATWTSSTTATATINSSGLATAVAPGTSTITAGLNGVTGATTLTVTAAPTVTSIAVTPSNPSIAAGATQQFTATATYSNNTTANVTSTATWMSSTTATATINSSGLATAVAAGTSTITAALNGVSGTTLLTVTASTSGNGTVNVTTFHFDNNRSGLNPNETILNTSNVNSSSFGKRFSYATDGYEYGTPLLVSGLTINGATHDVVYVATENDSVYAFDADNYGSGAPLWKVSVLQSGETPITDGPIQPVEGITSTPVIDTSSNTIYVVSSQKGSNGGFFRISALDLTTGAQKFGGPVTIDAKVPATNSDSSGGYQTLTTSCIQRAALLLANGNIYMGFGSCHSGWLLAYSASNLSQVGVWNASPNLNGEGAYASAGGVWMGGGGPVADSSGNVYITTGNGPWDGKTAWADSVLKFSPTLTLEDNFTPDAYEYMDCADADLASGGLLMIPGTSNLIAGGKIGELFLLNAANLGGETSGDTGAIQTEWFDDGLISPYSQSCTDANNNTWTTLINPFEIFGTAAYFNGAVYLGVTPTGSSAPSGVRQFPYSNNGSNSLTTGPMASPNSQEDTRGTTPFISANGTNDGIVWVIDQGQPIQTGNSSGPTSATLYAYDAANYPNQLYSSATNSGDAPGYGIKFSSPVVANGKVYISTAIDNYTATNPQGELVVYGLK